MLIDAASGEIAFSRAEIQGRMSPFSLDVAIDLQNDPPPVTVSEHVGKRNYAEIAKGFGCLRIRVDDPGKLNAALREGLANTSTLTVIDCVVTRDPARMLAAADNRTLKVQSGDRPV